ncbi:MAG: hypothetical protein IPJ14_14110 [Kineosporiaceae bacterium]|nr:hypothetical protein [Kineosporiaceae bacterium]
MVDFLEAALPSVGALVFFAIGLRALVHADRRERMALARYNREVDHPVAGRVETGPDGPDGAEPSDDVTGSAAERPAEPA